MFLSEQIDAAGQSWWGAGGSGEAQLLAANLPGCKSVARAPFSPGHAALGRSGLGGNGDDVQVSSPGCGAAAVPGPAVPPAVSCRLGLCFPRSLCW